MIIWCTRRPRREGNIKNKRWCKTLKVKFFLEAENKDEVESEGTVMNFRIEWVYIFEREGKE